MMASTISTQQADVFVCEGEEFHQTCSTNGSTVVWRITIPASNNIRHSIFVSQSRPQPDPPNFTDNGVHFEISKSSNSSHAIVSTVLIRNVTTYLNGTTVNCSMSSGTYSTIINVIKAGNFTLCVCMCMCVHACVCVCV